MNDEDDALKRPVNLAKMTQAQQQRFEELIEARMSSAKTSGETLTQDEIKKLAEQVVREEAD